ncbi:MAG: dockerin type I repeat-containing protein [Eubacteriales bacterium]|nr:dockerin type I repeat-containing protein [Eubacteriales bacterium]
MFKKQHIKKLAVVCIALVLIIVSVPLVTGAGGFQELFSLDTQSNNDAQELGLLGDANQDGQVTVIDATTIQKHLVELLTLDDIGMLLADVNEDGTVSVMDATLIQRWVAKIDDDTNINTILNQKENPGTDADDESTQPTAATEAGSSSEEETQPATDSACNLQFSKYGIYTGAYVEDGTDDYVENVAVLMVTNISDKYLEYAVVTFDISGTPAAFTVTGLAPGETAWVLEQNKLVIEEDAEFTYMDDITTFADDNSKEALGVDVTLGDGQLTVENNKDEDLKSVYVYYKLRHTDGNFLGGITYRVPMGDLAKGESASAVAVHCDGKNCEVVRIDWEG